MTTDKTSKLNFMLGDTVFNFKVSMIDDTAPLVSYYGIHVFFQTEPQIKVLMKMALCIFISGLFLMPSFVSDCCWFFLYKKQALKKFLDLVFIYILKMLWYFLKPNFL